MAFATNTVSSTGVPPAVQNQSAAASAVSTTGVNYEQLLLDAFHNFILADPQVRLDVLRAIHQPKKIAKASTNGSQQALLAKILNIAANKLPSSSLETLIKKLDADEALVKQVNAEYESIIKRRMESLDDDSEDEEEDDTVGGIVLSPTSHARTPTLALPIPRNSPKALALPSGAAAAALSINTSGTRASSTKSAIGHIVGSPPPMPGKPKGNQYF